MNEEDNFVVGMITGIIGLMLTSLALSGVILLSNWLGYVNGLQDQIDELKMIVTKNYHIEVLNDNNLWATPKSLKQ